MSELERLKEENARLRAQLDDLKGPEKVTIWPKSTSNNSCCPSKQATWDGSGHGLSKEQIARYSRQLILHNFGVHAQARLCRGSVLIVGAGGLGSPAALYLAAAGVGRLGIVDKDSVELNNLHRQIIHRESSVGQHKSLSAAASCSSLNSSITLETHCEGFTPVNAVDLVRQYDVVVDASDNAPTRYLISDACSVTRRPLVSGAAIGMDGQLTVYCHGEDGPCYRCLFPVAPRPESCSRCSDAGVLGAVPGVIGTLQAIEAIKILSGVGEPMSRRLLLLDTLSARFHVVKLRARLPTCIACGKHPSLTHDNLASYDYAAFTGQQPSDSAPPPLELIPKEERISPVALRERLQDGSRPFVLVDVRPPEQFRICHLPGALHAPFAKFACNTAAIRRALGEAGDASRAPTDGANSADAVTPPMVVGAGCSAATQGIESERPQQLQHGVQQGQQQLPVDLYVVCRRGNDSQRAVAALRALGISHAVDMVGGMEAWAQQVDPTFPTY